MRNRRSTASLLALLAAVAAGVSFAGPAKDIQVAGRALTFLENGPSGDRRRTGALRGVRICARAWCVQAAPELEV